MKRIASVLFAAALFTFIFSSCSTKVNVSQDDLENSLLLEWCGRFRASNMPEISITTDGQASRELIGNELDSTSQKLESILRTLTAEELHVCNSNNITKTDTFLCIADSVTEYRFYFIENTENLCVLGLPEAQESFLSDNEVLVVNNSDLYDLVEPICDTQCRWAFIYSDRLTLAGTHSVVSGRTYTLTVSGTAGGIAFTGTPVSKTCP